MTDDLEYPFLTGEIGSTDGVRMNKNDYRKITNEFIVQHSSAKHTRLSRESYAVGSLARFNLNYDKLYPAAKELAVAMGIKPKCINPYLNTAAQLIEVVHCLEDSVSILQDLRNTGINYDEEIILALEMLVRAYDPCISCSTHFLDIRVINR